MASSAAEPRLEQLLYVDAATCIASALLMTFATEPLAHATGLPSALLSYAGASLFPIAALMVYTGARALGSALVWLVIAGNVLWTLACLALLLSDLVAPNTFGQLFLGAQASAVALLAWLELRATRPRSSPPASDLAELC